MSMPSDQIIAAVITPEMRKPRIVLSLDRPARWAATAGIASTVTIDNRSQLGPAVRRSGSAR